MEKSKVNVLEGKEITEGYVRIAVPEKRSSHAWAIFKSNFFNIFLLNALLLVFLSPVIAIFMIKDIIISSNATLYPFGSNFGPGAPAAPDTIGMAEKLIFTNDLMFYALIIAAGLIAAVGVAGVAYSVKRMFNTEKAEFTFLGFFKGIKLGYVKSAIGVTVFTLTLFAAVTVCNWAKLAMAQGAGAFWPVTAMVLVIILTVLVGIYCAWFISVGTGYKVGVVDAAKTALSFFIATPIQSIFFAGVSVLSTILVFLWGEVPILGIIIMLMYMILGVAVTPVIWFNYTQWIFDIFLPPEAKVEKPKAKKVSPEQQKAMEEKDENMQLLAAGKSWLLANPVLPIKKDEISSIQNTFSREDIKNATIQKTQLVVSAQNYAKEHAKDKQYAEYNKLFADREKVIVETDKKGKKKKMISPDNLLR